MIEFPQISFFSEKPLWAYIILRWLKTHYEMAETSRLGTRPIIGINKYVCKRSCCITNVR